VTIVYHPAIVQGSDEWHALRCGMLTASEVYKIVNIPKVETRIKKNGEPYKQREWSAADNEETRAHLYELAAQRITRYVEPSYVSDDMLRGMGDEILARDLYSQRYAPVRQDGFITNDEWGFTLGYSPDGVVGDDGLIEVKSRRQKFQVKTIVHHVATGEIPAEYLLQCQTGLLVTRRAWLDFISYCGGMPMYVMRVYPDAKVHAAIIEAATRFHERLESVLAGYRAALADRAEFLTPTERVIEQEMTI
jgi:hypothetical protein